MSDSWQALQSVLEKAYAEQGIGALPPDQAIYLRGAFEETEEMWHEQLGKMERVRIVLLSEAPLYGDARSYIYNPDTPPTAFFYLSDLRAVIPPIEVPTSFCCAQAKKQFLIDGLKDAGILVLDVFPFALNPAKTTLNFRNLSKKLYCELLVGSTPDYLEPKLHLLPRGSSEEFPRFAYRYKRVAQRTGDHLRSTLERLNMLPPRKEIEPLSGVNMSLDRGKLGELFRASA